MYRLSCFLVIALVTVPIVSLAQNVDPLRVAVIIGANEAAPGRRMLRYAHNDARNVKSIFEEVGGFSSENVYLLLDPNPKDVLTLLDQQLSRISKAPQETMLLFYYSGHADEHAIYPNGEALTYSQLRKRLDNENADIRVGIVDTCRGGSWTGTRGLSEAEIFEVNIPLELSNQGSVLIASSSGLEDAHESADFQGGFFTHHWNAALRGAGDRNNDRKVSLTEAFEYAKRLTIRDTALRTNTPQHPSFQMNLRGRQDLVLANLKASTSVVSVEQTKGPIQLIYLDSGLIALETPEGRRSLRLVVPQGRYLVRVASNGQTRAREIKVESNTLTSIREEELEVVPKDRLVTRHYDPLPASFTTVPDDMWWIRVALGVSHAEGSPGLGFSNNDSDFASLFQSAYGISDRLQWMIPTLALVYCLGDARKLEWIPWGGLIGWGMAYTSTERFIFLGQLGVGTDLRWWLGFRHSLLFGLGIKSDFRWSSAHPPTDPDGNSPSKTEYAPTTWSGIISIGYTHTIQEAVTINVGAGYYQNFICRGDYPGTQDEFAYKAGLGSVQTLGLRSLPLVEIHISRVVSLDGYAALEYEFVSGNIMETYMLGASFIW